MHRKNFKGTVSCEANGTNFNGRISSEEIHRKNFMGGI